MTPHRQVSLQAVFLLALFLLPLFGLAAGQLSAERRAGAVAFTDDQVEVKDGVWTVTAPTASLAISEFSLEQVSLRLAVQLAAKSAIIEMAVLPENPEDLQKPSLLRVNLHRDANGRQLTAYPYRFDEKKQLVIDPGWPINYLTFWPEPTDKQRTAIAEASGQGPLSWQNRWLPLEVRADRDSVGLWFAGRLLQQAARPAGAKGPFVIKLGQGDRLKVISAETVKTSNGIPVDLSLYADAQTGLLDLGKAGWYQWKEDPAEYYELYDNGPVFLEDRRMPMARVPAADYTAAYITASYDGDPGHSNVVTLRAGRYGYAAQVVQHDFSALVQAGAMRRVRIPMTEAFAQDIENYFDIEITKEVRLARRQPDPCRFRTRPLGLPSGVKISGLELELSPLQMRVTSAEAGHVFVQPQIPTFAVTLRNFTGSTQAFRLTADAVHLDGTKLNAAPQAGKVEAGKTATVKIPLPASKRGYYDITVTLADGKGKVLLRRTTSFGVLAPDTRKHRAQSPFGTWDFYGGHFSPSDPKVLGPLYVKLGLRFGMFSANTDTLLKYGVTYGQEPVTLGPDGAKHYTEYLKKLPGFYPPALLFHEHGISGRHVTRVPDLFTDRPAYVLDETEKKTFDALFQSAVEGAAAVRKQYPQVRIKLGNGTLPYKEELYRQKFPAELFDSAGNESGTFGRPPEAQPLDYVANNASIWMDRQLLDAYGYQDKPVTQCYEITYPCTNPGNLNERTQADYMVRHALHSLAWDIPEIRVGLIADVGNSYYFSNWGASGFCRQAPEVSIKPSFISFATMTRVLDGAKFTRDVPLGSPSLYALEFALPEGRTAYALWTIHGTRPLALSVDGTDWTLIDSQGNETASAARGKVNVTVSSSVVYLVGKGKVTAVAAGAPKYAEKPQGKVAKLAPLADLADWTVVKERNPELETYDFMAPRRLGNFAFAPVNGAIKVTPQPIDYGKDTMPMYAVLAHKTGIPVPGKPTEIGLMVNGNGSWGRMIFELKDASGQRWISLGAQQEGDLSPWLQDWMPKEMLEKYPTPGLNDWNTGDVFGISRINFDGWRYLSFPLPGNYPGESYPWPANSQWRWDKDGVVHYPLMLTKLVIELPAKTLHLKDFSPAPRPEIYLKDLVTCKGVLRTSE